jgi:hypothetical protein
VGPDFSPDVLGVLFGWNVLGPKLRPICSYSERFAVGETINAAYFLQGEAFGDVRLFAAAFNKELKNMDFERY